MGPRWGGMTYGCMNVSIYASKIGSFDGKVRSELGSRDEAVGPKDLDACHENSEP